MTRTIFEKADVIPLLAEVFRELGYEGATLSRITERTGLSKGSLYHFFPGGKEEMAAVVLDHVHGWFIEHIFKPLEEDEPIAAIVGMWQAVDVYFCSGQRICLVGVFALDETRDRFPQAINRYFIRWIDALARALVRIGKDKKTAALLAENAVLSIQGALVLMRATADAGLFKRALSRLAEDLQLQCETTQSVRKPVKTTTKRKLS
ncbi:TetR/AcrR family transcriptional regulator [Acidocella sp.]|uniref:TetR/AcrR family transcriptional regulator n=1 Tax=Acidocella sp. TaxID=50710 RepID=UPI002F3F4383